MLQLLNNIDHKDLRVVTERGARWGDNVMSAPVIPEEFRKLQAHYPIVFQPDGCGSFQPIVLFGLKQGENLFLTEDGWTADYLPLSMQRMPFSIGIAGDELRMMVDMASPRIGGEADGVAVFMPHGGSTEFVEHANSVLCTLHEGLERMPSFVQALTTHGLLEPFTLEVERPDGSFGKLSGLSMIHEERLAALDAQTVGLLHQADFLYYIYMAIASMSNLSKLIQRHLSQEA
ncbi:SapC family protein [Roseateles sp. NT4]|uniref:SapC family protein n=1 Tax=Roseateles sp. NT4 TaxID=3453715 RepID=UPI003EE88825